MAKKFTLLSRYRDGEREEVWQFFRLQGDKVWDPVLFPEAWAVCEEACTRIRWNLECLVRHLYKAGYLFGDPGADGEFLPRQPIFPADRESEYFADWVQERFGPIGMMPMAFISLVGDVSLNGTWKNCNDTWLPTDPLVIEFQGRKYEADIRQHLEEEYQEWHSDNPSAEQFPLAFSPDKLHKANVSGGSPFSVLVPDFNVDPILDLDGERTTFVAYLNDCFRKKGFRNFVDCGQPELPEMLGDDLLAI